MPCHKFLACGICVFILNLFACVSFHKNLIINFLPPNHRERLDFRMLVWALFFLFSWKESLFPKHLNSNTCFIIIVTTLQACKLSKIAFNIQTKTSKVTQQYVFEYAKCVQHFWFCYGDMEGVQMKFNYKFVHSFPQKILEKCKLYIFDYFQT